jgi:hypothetical protein
MTCKYTTIMGSTARGVNLGMFWLQRGSEKTVWALEWLDLLLGCIV